MQPPFQANHFTLFFMQLYTCVYHCQVKTGYLSIYLCLRETTLSDPYSINDKRYVTPCTDPCDLRFCSCYIFLIMWYVQRKRNDQSGKQECSTEVCSHTGGIGRYSFLKASLSDMSM